MKQPNVLIVTCDQLRRDAIGMYNNRVIKTPNIDSLANESVVFDNHFTQHPVCMPSRWSIFTGRYPRHHGVTDNGVKFKEDEETLARQFKKNGYHTGAFGKMHFSPALLNKEEEDEQWPKDGFGFVIRHLTDDSKRGEYLNYLKNIDEESYEYVLKQGEEKVKEDLMSAADRTFSDAPQIKENKLDPDLHQTAWISNKVIDFMDEAKSKNKPFFGWCSYVDPHHPFDPPEPYASMYDPAEIAPPIPACTDDPAAPRNVLDMHFGYSPGNEKYDLSTVGKEGWKAVRAKYYGMVSLIDHNLGRIIEALKERDMYENTVIIFTSDHGELLGDHGLLFKGPFHYDGLIRVPLLIRYGDKVCGGARIKQITQHIDILPTLLSFCGIPLPRGVQGKPLQSLLSGDDVPLYEYALTEHRCYDWGTNIKTLRNSRWRLSYYGNPDIGELYDLYSDPTEMCNLWYNEEYADVKSELVNKLLDRLIETEDSKQPRLAKY
jgi:arylsulfatase